ncbi:MAG TPA: GNAT family N-acetyltransferase [Longimicrobiales bacterium]|nr:GNAT family N-acetyltransferase [Longimicrobiales bacterium]
MSHSLVFRFADADDVPAAARMVAHSFPGPQRPPEWWETQLRTPHWGGGAETLLIGADSGRMVAALQAHPLRQWIAGVEFGCTGIGSVAIAPTHRRRGLGAELMNAALRTGRERGDVVSALYPFRTSFYRRLGYGIAGMAEQYRIAPAMLPDAPERERVELIEAIAARTDAYALYRDWVSGQTGQLARTHAIFTQVTYGPDRALFGWRSESGALEGYAVVIYRTEPARYLDVDELVWTSDAARRGLIGWLASLGDQWPELVLRALPSHRMTDWITEPRLPHGSALPWRLWAPAATLLLGTMSRILDVPAAFAQRSLAGDEPLDIIFDVADAQIPENAGCWRITNHDGASRVERSATSQPTVRLDISTLSRLFIGALPASAALAAGLLECDRPAVLPVLDRALALPEPWTFDRF